ncbi:lytic murein transglycosylase B [Methylonatrum kenyense]|uniref:lytic murein transglycosylase B n=1 Tax=Methylonatrum kenyense TaxID=455253 RepID=UPI0020BE138E|nr:lytic murein transglycosylase B [Methylonatrum kenyense]MCK8516543.1 lytic murein transglycosylase B [Methylonatrum kenyense]
MNRTPLLHLLLAALLFISMPAVADSFAEKRADIDAFADQMAERHGLSPRDLKNILQHAEHRQDIIDAISRPAEAMPWYRYRPIFIREDRIDAGIAFWEEYAVEIQRASEEFGVSEAIIVAIIGVETRYGEHQGRHRVLDALTTLAFDYPPRADFFRSELEHYLLLAEEEGFDPLTIRGSYAGAMGIPQFISSSYRAYAVDGDGDGRRDLLSNTADAVSSVANYFAEHRWREGDPVVFEASLEDDAEIDGLANQGRQPYTTVGELRAAGVVVDESLDDELGAVLMELDGEQGKEYWVGLHNFYVITRYNHSPLYALAVWQLSEMMRERRETDA